MDSPKRIYFACRAAVAELNGLAFAWSVIIFVSILAFTVLVSGEIDRTGGQFQSAFQLWTPLEIIGIIAVAGWLGGLIMGGTIHNRFFKEENQAVRTLSLPLSNAERFASMLVLQLLFVPLICLGLPLLVTFLGYLVAPDYLFLPDPVYLWLALPFGWLAHTTTTLLWFFPTTTMPKKVGFLILGGVLLTSFYLNWSYTNTTNQLAVSHQITAPLAPDVYGLSDYSFHDPDRKKDTVKVNFQENNYVVYPMVLSFLLIVIASGMAITHKTA